MDEATKLTTEAACEKWADLTVKRLIEVYGGPWEAFCAFMDVIHGKTDDSKA